MKTIHAGTVRDEGPSSVRVNPEHFAPQRAKILDANFEALCCECGAVAHGARLESCVDEIALFHLLCRTCGPPPHGWACLISNMWPWRVVRRLERGVYQMARKVEKERR